VRRSLTFTAAWLAAAAVATTAAWQGVGLVTNQVTDDRPSALAASDVSDRLDGTSPTTATAPPTSPSTSASTPSTTTPDDEAVIVPYDLVGGRAALRFTPTAVTVEWSRPNPGFSVKTEPEDGNGYRVEFESETHRSRVTGWWDGGPQDEQREDPR